MGTTPTLPFWDRVEGFVHNALTGTLTDAQKQTLANQEAAALVQASGGNLSASDAAAQAQSDVTAVLKINNADPSQASLFNNPGLASLFSKIGWLVAAVGIFLFFYFSLLAYRAFREA